MPEPRIHEYFKRKSSEWNILAFLEECDEEIYQSKISYYLKSLQRISQSEKGRRQERAKALNGGVEWTSKVHVHSSLQSQATKLVVGRRQSPKFVWCSSLQSQSATSPTRARASYEFVWRSSLPSQPGGIKQADRISSSCW
ncbi:hypothetical protein BC938DRAFT_472306 [Jimgerdemannia flammicorona]|uniref:Uncharacterized protein n=1 Tax=Jimgerdemannia flammicorona TaxID=994334 RepID=A0A433Q6C6_9FUNG|nr:hypothetical protein BC938DRAFT_472306 [Jimgerdemannia flammicorona]